MSLAKTLCLFAVGIITLYVPFTFATQKTNWLKELRTMGFEGRTVWFNFPEWRREGISTKVFVVKQLPLAIEPSRTWRHLSPELLREFRRVTADGDLVMVFTVSPRRGTPVAGVGRDHGELGPLTQGTAANQVLLWTPRARALTLPHEERHFLDNRAGLDRQILSGLSALQFPPRNRYALAKLIVELRAYVHQVNFATREQELLLRQSLRSYELDAMAALSDEPIAQRQKYVAFLRSYLADIKANQTGSAVLDSFSTFACERELTSEISKR